MYYRVRFRNVNGDIGVLKVGALEEGPHAAKELYCGTLRDAIKKIRTLDPLTVARMEGGTFLIEEVKTAKTFQVRGGVIV